MKFFIGLIVSLIVAAVIGAMIISKDFRDTAIQTSVDLKEDVVVLVVGEDGWGSEEDGWGGREKSLEKKADEAGDLTE